MSRNPRKHLTEEEFLGFILEDLPTETAEVIDQHLEHCVACAQQLEDFYAAQEEFPTRAWAAQRGAFVATLRRQIFDRPSLWEGLRAFLESFSYPLALAPQFATSAPLDVESEDGTYGAFVEEARNGDVIVRLDSTVTELEGATICLQVGKWQRDVCLTRVADDQVGVEVVISRSERAALSPGTVLRATLMGGESRTDGTLP